MEASNLEFLESVCGSWRRPRTVSSVAMLIILAETPAVELARGVSSPGSESRSPGTLDTLLHHFL